MKEIVQALNILFSMPLFFISVLIIYFFFLLSDLNYDSIGQFLFLIVVGLMLWVISKVIRSNLNPTEKIGLSCALIIISPWVSFIAAGIGKTIFFEITPLYVHSVHYSPNKEYKIIFKRFYIGPGLSGDGGGYVYTHFIKRNKFFYFPIIRDRGYFGQLVWSEDSQKVAFWFGDYLSNAYDLKTGKELRREDDVPLSPVIKMLNLGIDRFCYPDHLRNESEAFIHACWISDLPVIEYALQEKLVDEKLIQKEYEKALLNRRNEVLHLLETFEKIQFSIEQKLFSSVDSRRWSEFIVFMDYATLEDINYQGRNGITALINASQKGMLNFIEKLVDAGANIHIIDSENHNALYWAVYYQHNQVVDYLVEKGAKLIRDDLGHLLFEAASKGDQRIFNICLQSASKEQLNHHDIDKLTPLIIASQKGHFDMVKQLVEAGADVNAADVSYETAIRHAFFNKHYDITEYLIRNDADPGVKSIYGSTFLHDPKMQEIIRKVANE